MSDMNLGCFHQKSKSHRDLMKIDIVIPVLLGCILKRIEMCDAAIKLELALVYLNVYLSYIKPQDHDDDIVRSGKLFHLQQFYCITVTINLHQHRHRTVLFFSLLTIIAYSVQHTVK